MRVLITGVGDAFTRTHFGCSGVIQPHDARGFVLIDCPDLIHRTLHEAAQRSGWKLDVSMIDDVILTHLHGDHCNGLESFGFYRRIQRLRDPRAIRPRLHITEPVADRLWERLAPAMETPIGDDRISRLEDYFDVRILTPGTLATVGGLSVECRFTKHPVPTIGLLVREGDRSGRGLGWSGDTPFEREHIDWLNRAGVIVHESNVGPSHTPIERLNALPIEIKSKMRLTHLPDDFDPAATDIAILREGDVLEA
jgi:ribonuclease BN (tRNA processing enzyme)